MSARNNSIVADLTYTACDTYGAYEVTFPGRAILDIARPGPADEAMAYWIERIERPAEATVEAVRRHCEETGAWDDAELNDDATNWTRMVWMLACDIGENGGST